MRTGGTNRRWLVAGALGAVALFALGWVFLIGPERREAAGLRDQTAAQQLQVGTLQHQLAELRSQAGKLVEYRSRLAKQRQALPAEADLADFLRELRTAGDAHAVAVTGLIVGSPIVVAGSDGALYALPITLTVEGPAGRMNEFLAQLQQVQPRAVLISGVSGTAKGGGGSFAGQVVFTVQLQAYVAPTAATKPS
jgi:Tfp pilus assembly protein PilO